MRSGMGIEGGQGIEMERRPEMVIEQGPEGGPERGPERGRIQTTAGVPPTRGHNRKYDPRLNDMHSVTPEGMCVDVNGKLVRIVQEGQKGPLPRSEVEADKKTGVNRTLQAQVRLTGAISAELERFLKQSKSSGVGIEAGRPIRLMASLQDAGIGGSIAKTALPSSQSEGKQEREDYIEGLVCYVADLLVDSIVNNKLMAGVLPPGFGVTGETHSIDGDRVTMDLHWGKMPTIERL